LQDVLSNTPTAQRLSDNQFKVDEADE